VWKMVWYFGLREPQFSIIATKINCMLSPLSVSPQGEKL